MSLLVFRNKNRPTDAENRFFRYLISLFKDTNLDIGLFFNVFVDGTELDTLVASEKGIFILEYKNYSGKLFASENGEWRMLRPDGREVDVGKGGENVFQQLRRQRFALMRLINENFYKIFPKYSKKSKSTHHIGSYLVFEELHPDSEIDISNKSKLWLKIVSKSDVVDNFYHQTPSNLTFKSDEIINLAALLKMKQDTVGDSGDYDAAEDFCPVCLYSEKCYRKFLNGTVLDIDDKKIRVKDNSRVYDLLYNKRSVVHRDNHPDKPDGIRERKFDDTELKILTNIFRYFMNNKLDIPLEINLFHLSESKSCDFEITDDTLMVILPSWLYSVTEFANLDFCERSVITEKFSLFPNNSHILRGSAVNESLESVVKNPEDVAGARGKAGKFLQSHAVELLASGTDAETIDDAIDTEVEKLAEWASRYNMRHNKETEEFVISTRLGLKGKIDLVLKDEENRIVDILELKSSKPDWNSWTIKEYHELQVVAYGMMVLMKQERRFYDLGGENPAVIYSKADDNIRKPARFDSEIFAKVFKYRNILLNSEFSLTLPNPFPHPMPYKRGCENCSRKKICMDICRIIQFEYCDSVCFKHPQNRVISTSCDLRKGIFPEFEQSFRRWIDILNRLRIVKHKKYAELIEAEQSENKSNGRILEIRGFPDLETEQDGKYLYRFSTVEGNYSEFREFDIVLLASEYNLEKADLILGVIRKLTFEDCLVEVNKELKMVPKFIFPYYPGRLEYLNYSGIYEGFFGESELFRLLLDGKDGLKDFFDGFNVELLQGVPGSGKTTEIVKRILALSGAGKKVFVATFTNKALDNIHEKLLKKDSGIREKIFRFGSRYRVGNYENGGPAIDYHDSLSLKDELSGKTVYMSTLHSANSEFVSNIADFDYVIIDEAGQINIPMSFLPMSLAGNVLLVGDHFQLPPIFFDDVVDYGGDKEMFTSIFQMLWDKTENVLGPERRKQLTRQFRMVEEIAAYPSEAFYSNSIVTDGKVKKDQEVFMDSFNDKWKKSYLSEVIDPGVPSVCIQVNGGDSMRGFRLNEKEAELCVSIISGFVEAGVRPEQIGVISPFRLQVHTIKVKLSRALGKSYPNILEDLQVDTIDRFQGSEKDIVLLSLCSNGGKNNFLLRDLRRFNVAITRARFKRIILGDLLSFRYGDDEKKRRIAGIINDGVTRLIDSDKLRGR